MATPANNSTPITLLGIQREVFNNNYNASNTHSDISLTDLSEEADENFNANSPSKPDGNTPHAMSEWYNYDHDAAPAFTWGTNGGVSQGWGSASGNSPFTANATCSLGFAFQPANDRVRVKHGNGNNSSAVSYSYNSVSYTGADPDQVEFKIVWTGVFSGSTTSSSEASGSTSGTYYQMSKQTTSSDSGTFTMRNWFIQKSSGVGGAAYNAIGANSPQWTYRAKDSSGNVIATSGTSSQNGISLSVTRGQQGGEFFCIHEDIMIQTEQGLMSVKDVADKDPKIWTYNWNTGEKELQDQNHNIQIVHNNLYTINDNFKITEDHIMYDKEKREYTINPDATLDKYGKTSQKLSVGISLKTFDGTDFIVEKIERYEGDHWTYTISTDNGNFYAGNLLVDSEI
tara:strand:- start:494 stop:1690 length:1197 start_codon:yes stop_codon:yes gene_type:complete